MNSPSLMTPPPGGAGRASLQATTGRIAAVATALLLVLFLVLSVSRAAFVAETRNDGNSIDSGTVNLTDNDGDSALFSITDATPGVDTERCIKVRYTGNFTTGDIKMFVTKNGAETTLGDLAPYVNVNVQTLPYTDTPVFVPETDPLPCTDFNIAALATTPGEVYDGKLDAFGDTYQTGAAAAAPHDFKAVDQTTRWYKITVSVEADPLALGKTALWDFAWATHTAA